MVTTQVLFLGVDSVTPAAGDDTASFVLNRRILVDTGWTAPVRLLDHGLSVLDLDALVFTHLHHDHYLALPQVLFYRWMRGRTRDLPPLVIAGPREDLGRIVQLAKAFLEAERCGHHPRLELRPLDPGDRLETAHGTFTTARTIHAVPGLCYRFEDAATGAVVAFTGDTAYHPPLAEHVRGADLLIHEASHGAADHRGETASGHSGAPAAAAIAAAAGVGRLALVHGAPAVRDEAVAAAQQVFAETFWPAPGEVVEVTAGTDSQWQDPASS